MERKLEKHILTKREAKKLNMTEGDLVIIEIANRNDKTKSTRNVKIAYNVYGRIGTWVSLDDQYE